MRRFTQLNVKNENGSDGLFTFTDPDSNSKFESHSCSWKLRVGSESDSTQCGKFYIVHSSHLVCSPNWNRVGT